MDYRALSFWYQVIQGGVTLGLALYVWIGNRQKVTQRTIDRLREETDKRISTNHDRITVLEQQVKTGPSSHQVNKLGNQITGLDGDLKALREELKGLRGSISPFTAAVSRIETYLLESQRK